jgi:hypothetical protein
MKDSKGSDVRRPAENSIGHSPELKAFIQEHGYLWWWMPEEKKKRLSLNSIVEAVLNHGTEKSVKRLLELIGTKRVSDIFFQQISGRRNNYHKRTLHFFKLYFQRHAQRNTH